LYAYLFQVSNYVETHMTEIKQLQDARKGTAPFVGKMLKEVMMISSAHILEYFRFQITFKCSNIISVVIVSMLDSCTIGRGFLTRSPQTKYSHSCIKRLPMGQRKSDLIRHVTS
jgi:hypothetical protein